LRRPGPRLRRPTKTFLLLSALSSVGTGLVYPLVAIYIVRTRHLDLSVASVYFVATAVAGICISTLAGLAVDHIGARAVVVAGTALDGCGLCVFAVATRPAEVVLAAAITGTGNGAFFTALTPLFAALEPGEVVNRAFAVRSWTINLANGIGLLGGGTVAAVFGARAFGPLFLADGLTSITLAIATLLIPVASATSDIASTERARLRDLLADRSLLAVLAADALTTMFGFALFEAVIPAAFVLGSRGSAAIASAVVLASVIIIVAVQLPLSRWTARWRRTSLLQAQAVVWVVASGVAFAFGGGGGGWWTAICFGALFGVGECFYSASIGGLVAASVPPALQGQFNGLLSLLSGLGLAVGPPAGFWILGHLSARVLWLVVAASAGAAAALWRVVVPGSDVASRLSQAIE
jgi:MFS family permease